MSLSDKDSSNSTDQTVGTGAITSETSTLPVSDSDRANPAQAQDPLPSTPSYPSLRASVAMTEGDEVASRRDNRISPKPSASRLPLLLTMLMLVAVAGVGAYYSTAEGGLFHLYTTPMGQPEAVAEPATISSPPLETTPTTTSQQIAGAEYYDLVYTNATGERQVLESFCKYCVEDMVVFDDWLLYQKEIVPEGKSGEEAIVLYAMNLEDRSVQTVYTEAEFNRLFGIKEDRKLYGFRLYAVHDHLYLSAHSFEPGDALFELIPSGSSWQVEKIAAAEQVSYGSFRVEAAYDRTWLIRSDGDGCGGYSSYFLLDQETNEYVPAFDTGSGCTDGYSIAGYLEPDTLVVYKHEEGGWEPGYNYIRSIEFLTFNLWFEKDVVVAARDLPEAPAHVRMNQDTKMLYLVSGMTEPEAAWVLDLTSQAFTSLPVAEAMAGADFSVFYDDSPSAAAKPELKLPDLPSGFTFEPSFPVE